MSGLSLAEIFHGLVEELTSGRMGADVYASLFRLFAGLFLAILVGTPLGLWLGHHSRVRRFLVPPLNFLRSISPLAWIPFAVVWFGIGDPPVIFLIFVGCLLPWLFATAHAVQTVPDVYFRVAHDHHFQGWELLSRITFPAIAPSLLQTSRLIATLGWIILVPAEMLAGREGLGFAIMDARNGMRIDLLVVNILVIGALAHAVDTLLQRLALRPEVRWGHER
jgi:NitT/TauT family transport system permease protein